MNKLFAAIEVLRTGRELKNAAAWKNTQALTLFLTALGSLAVIFFPDVGQNNIDRIISGAVAVFSIYLTYATSGKVGVLPAKEPTSVTIIPTPPEPKDPPVLPPQDDITRPPEGA